MMAFSNLSNELILLIWKFADVEDIYNFSTVSKRVYFLVHEALHEHCKLFKRLSIISNVGAERGEPGLFGRILKEVLLNPRAARYPSLLKIGEWEPEWRDGKGYSRDIVPAGDLELFKQAARNTIDLSREELEEEEWLAAIDRGDEEPLIALLLMLLPNLRHIDFNPVDESSLSITNALRTIVDDKDSSSLRKLCSVNLELARPSHEEVLDVELVHLFAGLPSVASIYGHGVGTCPEDLLYAYYGDETKVTNLTFVNCCIHPKDMFEFLSTTRNLQQFFYSAKGSAGNPAHFDPFWIRSALLANAQDTLLSLAILANGQETCFMGSLANFTCLGHVVTDLRLLTGDPSTPDHSLSDVLPTSIINIKLHIDYSSDATYLKDIIQDICDYPNYFRQLEIVIVVGVADVRAAELSHENQIRELEGRGTSLFFVTE